MRAFGQTIAFDCRLVSRSAGSGVTGVTPVAGTDNVALDPDGPGIYEIGVRACDGPDNSALTVASFRAGNTPSRTSGSAGGGGGCSVARPGACDSGTAAGTVPALLIALSGSLASGRGAR